MASARRSRDHKPSNLSEPALKQHDFASSDQAAAHPRPSGEVLDDTDTESNSSDEFDWSGDEDELGDAGDKRVGKTKARRGRAVWLAFMKLARPLRMFLLMILGSGILITPLLVFQLRFSDNPARPHVFVWSLWLSITWATACGTSILVDLLPRMFIRLVDLFGGRVENLKTQIELTMAVSNWLKLALDISWSWIALSGIRAGYRPPGTYWVIVNRVLQALFSAGLIILAEKVFLRYVAINYHETALAERLAENRLGLKALDRLSNAQPMISKKPAYAAGTARGHKTNRSSIGLGLLGGARGITASGLSSSSNSPTNEKPRDGLPSVAGKDVSDVGMTPRDKRQANKEQRKKALASVLVDQIGTAIGEVALKNSQFHKQNDYNNLYSARKLAQKLFETLSAVMPPRSHLLVDDFVPYFNSETEARAAFALFDKDGNGDITKKEMREAVQRIYRERKSLVSSLQDVSSAVGKLDAVLLGVALLIILFICLLIFNRENTLTSLVPLATIVLGFSFIFGHSAQLLFESMIFTFSTHTFDIGDLVMIDDMILFVKELGLFCVTFKRVDGMEVIVPTSLLSSSKLIHNLRRSGSMWETTNLMVAYDTPLGQIETLRHRLKSYVTNNSREWSAVDINIDKMPYQNEIHLIVAMEHRPNWQDWGGRWARRTKFMRHMKEVLEELDIRYTKPVQPVMFTNGAPPFRNGLGRAGFDSRESLGNAGYYAGSPEITRAPVRSMRAGPGIRID